MIRVLATSFAIKLGSFTQDSGFDWFGGSVGGGHVGERERTQGENQRYCTFVFKSWYGEQELRQERRH